MHVIKRLFLGISVLAVSQVFGQKVEYQDQSITITEAEVRKNEVRAGVSGIQFTGYAHFAYGQENIIGAMESEYLKQYYFFLEIKQGDNSNRIFFPVHTPDEEIKLTTFDEYFKIRVSAPGKYFVRIFIPYHHFQLIPGLHSINVSLSACDEKAKFYWRNLFQTDITIEQPQTYLAKLSVNKARLTEQKYDMSANKIPFFGLFVGGKNSKSGQGLPDAGWKVIVGNDIMYESPTNKNSLDVIPGNATFKISKGDPVKLIFFDDDYFKSDQVVGTVNYTSNTDIGTDEKKDYRFDNINTSEIIFEKTLVPSISSMLVDYKITKFQGVTGIELEIMYVMAGLQKNDAVMLRPVFRNKNGKTFVPEFIKLVENDFEINAATGNMVTRKNGPAKHIFFIPHYACMPEMFPGIEFIMDDYNQVVQSSFSSKKLESFGVITDDVKISIGAAEENSYNGYMGLKFPLVVNIPEMYYDDIKFTDIENSVRIFIDDTMEITHKMQIVSFFGDSSLGSFNMRKIRHDKMLHIPYSKLNLSNQDHRVTVYSRSFYLGNGTVINKDTFNLEISNPKLVHVVPFIVGFKIKSKNFENGFARIYRGNTLLRTLNSTQENKTKKYRFTVDVSDYWFHSSDEIRIEIIGMDYFKTEKILYKTVVEPLQINYNIIPERRKIPKTVKAFRLRRAPKTK